MRLRRYWFEFALPAGGALPLGLRSGCGVTAYDQDDALTLLRQRVFKTEAMPAPRSTKEDVDIGTLDLNHVRPNMGNPTHRGIWFPLGYDQA